MSLEKELEWMGIRSNVGVASICCKDYEQIKRMWKETDIGYVVLKTFMDVEDTPEEKAFTCKQSADQNMTLFHTGTTSKESHTFENDNAEITTLIYELLSDGIAVIPSIGTKKTDEVPWAIMEENLANTGARLIELNLRYLYRGLTSKYAEEVRQATGRNIVCDEYFSKNIQGTENMSDKEERYIRESANREFKRLLQAIREIFPPEQYALIAKLWPNPELREHIAYLVESYFDSVTLMNSLKMESPKPFEGIRKGKLPQMSGLRLRQYRNAGLYLAGEMGCKLPIFASGGVAVEAIRKPVGFNGNLKSLDENYEQKNIEEGVADILKCFQSGASYVQLGTVAHIGGYCVMARIMRELKGI